LSFSITLAVGRIDNSILLDSMLISALKSHIDRNPHLTASAEAVEAGLIAALDRWSSLCDKTCEKHRFLQLATAAARPGMTGWTWTKQLGSKSVHRLKVIPSRGPC
jgi:hypothetical protein